MEVQVLNTKGQSVRKVALPESIFGVEMNEHVLHTVVKAYRANRRQGTHATKTKAMVSGGGKKPFKQKGTGEARQGSSRSPLNPGGGVAHGPQPRRYTEKVNVKTKLLALSIALSDKVRHGKLVIVDDFAVSGYDTKAVVSLMSNIKTSRALLLDERKDDFLYKSARNIYGSRATTAVEVNAEHVLGHESFVISETALNVLKARFQGE
jgi:large subunit ribosomal protein L4